MSTEHEAWYDQWKAEKAQLIEYFNTKQYKETKPTMSTYTQLFITKLCELNKHDHSEINIKELDTLEYKPINIAERIQYVQDNLTQYHAFIQLDALYDELIKLYAKASILRGQLD
ncbi:hypothetical protein SAMN05421734_102399 [Pelagirhabdus alkalitolerans]|uniref:YpoC-like domain-containing protein n=1 Tax=Pelagirhabdus alkalitolerans TaxID=1612202 RepID=A0A1G6HAB6_9BACI|nr:hypothetical protein [Pelagirhabdus alkalitolerans]SDB91028.1 hypothetical protein SAMN05421734_102399 [Pelagirhabdus alkalitolerans]